MTQVEYKKEQEQEINFKVYLNTDFLGSVQETSKTIRVYMNRYRGIMPDHEILNKVIKDHSLSQSFFFCGM